MMKRVALVTGGNRGIGKDICRQLAMQNFIVILTARDMDKGQDAANELKELDVTEIQTFANRKNQVLEKFGRLDVLINNAGILIDDSEPALLVGPQIIRDSIETNLIGPLVLCQTFIPLMQKQNYGRIINVSTGMAAFSGIGSGYAGYRLSKVALNAMTKILSNEVAGSNILINAMCPGWVRTDMGGAGAPRTVKQGADTAIYLATLPDGGPSGKFFRDRREISW